MLFQPGSNGKDAQWRHYIEDGGDILHPWHPVVAVGMDKENFHNDLRGILFRIDCIGIIAEFGTYVKFVLSGEKSLLKNSTPVRCLQVPVFDFQQIIENDYQN
jgi:hypothetical protein